MSREPLGRVHRGEKALVTVAVTVCTPSNKDGITDESGCRRVQTGRQAGPRKATDDGLDGHERQLGSQRPPHRHTSER